MALTASLPEKLNLLPKSQKWDTKGKGQCHSKQQSCLSTTAVSVLDLGRTNEATKVATFV